MDVVFFEFFNKEIGKYDLVGEGCIGVIFVEMVDFYE